MAKLTSAMIFTPINMLQLPLGVYVTNGSFHAMTVKTQSCTFATCSVFHNTYPTKAGLPLWEAWGPTCLLVLAEGGSVNKLLSEKSLIPICM